VLAGSNVASLLVFARILDLCTACAPHAVTVLE
jgi:hypothetical protein